MAMMRPLLGEPGETCLLEGSNREAGMANDVRLLAEEVELYFRELRGPVYSYVFGFCGSPERAEELTQEVFLRLHAYLRAGNAISNVRSWVFRVAHNLAVNEGKKRRYELPKPMDAEIWHTRSDPGPDPEQLLLRGERSSRFWSGMAALTDHQRHCMQMRAEGLGTQEIADILKISRGGVVDTLQRAVKRLRKTLQ